MLLSNPTAIQPTIETVQHFKLSSPTKSCVLRLCNFHVKEISQPCPRASPHLQLSTVTHSATTFVTFNHQSQTIKTTTTLSSSRRFLPQILTSKTLSSSLHPTPWPIAKAHTAGPQPATPHSAKPGTATNTPKKQKTANNASKTKEKQNTKPPPQERNTTPAQPHPPTLATQKPDAPASMSPLKLAKPC
jgi:hypothetical protein